MTLRGRAALTVVLLSCTPVVEIYRLPVDAGEDGPVDVPEDGPVVGALPPGWSLVASGATARLRAIAGSRASDVWAAGEAGTAVHWDGTAWSRVATGTTATLVSVWVGDPASAWAVGTEGMDAAVLLRWDGSAWSRVASPVGGRFQPRGVWGSGDADVWVVGGGSDQAAALHWTGSGWRIEPVGDRVRPLLAVAGTGPGNVRAIGEGALAFRWNGASWSAAVGLPRGASFTGGFCVTSADGAWATGPAGSVYHFDAGAWSAPPLGTIALLRGVWCAREGGGLGGGQPRHRHPLERPRVVHRQRGRRRVVGRLGQRGGRRLGRRRCGADGALHPVAPRPRGRPRILACARRVADGGVWSCHSG